MSQVPPNPTAELPVETVLREELAHGDTVLGTIAPILGHLVVSPEYSLFSDEIVARVRGMAASVARQLLTAQARAGGDDDPDYLADKFGDALVEALLAHPEILAHFHALTIERQLADKLEHRNSIDPVLSPLLQSLIASDDANTASLGMTVLAAQARFVQQQRRMELPLIELPGELFHTIILVWRTHRFEGSDEIAAQAEMHLRAEYDEGSSRLGLLKRLITGMGSGALAALSIAHAGVALFLTALAIGSSQHRDLATISTNDRLVGRLAVGLRAAGLKVKDVEEQFLLIHPEISLPEGFDMLRQDRAAQLLSASEGQGGR